MQKHLKTSDGMSGRYLYAIVAGSEDRSYQDLGIVGGNVYTISDGHTAAVVSDVPNQKIRPERRYFAAHQAVLRKLMEDTDLLPMAFGIISAGPKSVRAILSRNRKAISSQLMRVSGKVEMGLKVSWDVPNIFEYMVKIHPDLMEARDRLLNSPRGTTHEQKLELGRLFERLLEADRDRHTDQVEDTLGPVCSEIKRNKCREERDVMNLACLVARTSIAAFETRVLKAASLFDDNFSFDYSGPWAPHNFVEIEMDI